MDGYNFVRKDGDRHGGGVGIYVRKGINFDVRNDLNRPNLECFSDFEGSILNQYVTIFRQIMNTLKT